MSVYPPPRAAVKRWDNAPRCGVWMPVAKEPCARTAGHKNPRDHRTAYALECMRLIKWRGVE